MTPPNFWKIVILCFERCFSKQDSVIRLKSYDFDPQNLTPKIFWHAPKFLGWLRHYLLMDVKYEYKAGYM